MGVAFLKKDPCTGYIGRDTKLLDELYKRFVEKGYEVVDYKDICYAWRLFSQDEFSVDYYLYWNKDFLDKWFDYFVKNYFVLADSFEEVFK